jgi:hypothetical protein
MSPRKNNVLTVEGWSDPKKGKLCKGIVKKADVGKKQKRIFVIIENLNPTQLGRIHEVSFDLPVRPGNRTSLFLIACGIDANTIGTKICLEDIVNTTIGMRFGAVAEDRSQRIDFERIEDPSRVQANTPGGDTEGAQLGGSTPKSEAEGEREF